jgi:hypothetical protein
MRVSDRCRDGEADRFRDPLGGAQVYSRVRQGGCPRELRLLQGLLLDGNIAVV